MDRCQSATAGPSVRTAEVDGVMCALDGRVYEVGSLAADLGVQPTD